MPGVLLSLWQKIVKPQSVTPAREAAEGSAERSVWIQECARVAALDDMPASESPDRFPAIVEEISKSEICLRAGKQIRRSSLLTIELPRGQRGRAESILA